jgi:hypothetical protein
MRKFCLVILISLVVGPPLAFAQTTYRWVDEKGGVHFTDDPTGIPEKDQVEERKEGSPSEPSPPVPQEQPSVRKPAAQVKKDEPVPAKTDAVGRGEEWWRGQVASWQQKLADAQKNYQSASAAVREKQRELEQAKFKPNSFKRKLRGELKVLEDKASEGWKQVEEAKNMLDHGLAKQAEESLADPNWVKNK